MPSGWSFHRTVLVFLVSDYRRYRIPYWLGNPPNDLAPFLRGGWVCMLVDESPWVSADEILHFAGHVFCGSCFVSNS